MTDLNQYLIDTVQPILDDAISEDDSSASARVQMIRYSVLATTPDEAIRRFVEEEAGVIVEEATPNDMVIVGISMGPGGIEVGR